MFVTGCQQSQADNVSFLSAWFVFARFLCGPGLTPAPAPELCYTSKDLLFLCGTGLDYCVFVDLSAAQAPLLHFFSTFGLSSMVFVPSQHRCKCNIALPVEHAHAWLLGQRAVASLWLLWVSFTGFWCICVGTEADVRCQRTPSPSKSW